MQLRKPILVACALLALSVINLAPAQAEDMALATGIRRLGAPGSLDASKRLTRLSAVLKVAGAPATAAVPPTLEMHLAPMAPRAANGALITRAGTVVLQGPEANEPEGSYALMRGAGMVAMSSIEMSFPTEPGKFYLVDCRVRTASSSSQTQFIVTRGSSTSVMPAEDGHIITAFSATASKTALVVAAMPGGPSDTAALFGYFYACDVGKAS